MSWNDALRRFARDNGMTTKIDDRYIVLSRP